MRRIGTKAVLIAAFAVLAMIGAVLAMGSASEEPIIFVNVDAVSSTDGLARRHPIAVVGRANQVATNVKDADGVVVKYTTWNIEVEEYLRGQGAKSLQFTILETVPKPELIPGQRYLLFLNAALSSGGTRFDQVWAGHRIIGNPQAVWAVEGEKPFDARDRLTSWRNSLPASDMDAMRDILQNNPEELAVRLAPQVDLLPTPDRKPPLDSINLPPAESEDQEQERRNAIRNEAGEKGLDQLFSGTTRPAEGLEIAGTVITVAGKEIKLPPDVYIQTAIDAGLCTPGKHCPQPPIYVLARGNSTIGVSAPTGSLHEEKIAAEEEWAFDFLREALKNAAR